VQREEVNQTAENLLISIMEALTGGLVREDPAATGDNFLKQAVAGKRCFLLPGRE
jgi:hypothetical protein